LYNRGDDHGEARDFSPMVVVATSSQAAIDNLWNSMNERCDKHFETADRIIAEVERLKTESKFAEAAQREREATKPGGELGQSVPDEPKDKERWRSWKIFVPKGYRIIRDPDAKAAPIIVDPATQG
jgi:hypothetical protein